MSCTESIHLYFCICPLLCEEYDRESRYVACQEEYMSSCHCRSRSNHGRRFTCVWLGSAPRPSDCRSTCIFFADAQERTQADRPNKPRPPTDPVALPSSHQLQTSHEPTATVLLLLRPVRLDPCPSRLQPLLRRSTTARAPLDHSTTLNRTLSYLLPLAVSTLLSQHSDTRIPFTTMADVAAAPKPDQQVDLNTIPISPSDDMSGSGESKEQKSSAPTSDSEIRTVFDDPENFNVKHPLMNTWTLWFTKPPSGKVRFQRCPWHCFANSFRETTGTSF